MGRSSYDGHLANSWVLKFLKVELAVSVHYKLHQRMILITNHSSQWWEFHLWIPHETEARNLPLQCELPPEEHPLLERNQLQFSLSSFPSPLQRRWTHSSQKWEQAAWRRGRNLEDKMLPLPATIFSQAFSNCFGPTADAFLVFLLFRRTESDINEMITKGSYNAQIRQRMGNSTASFYFYPLKRHLRLAQESGAICSH